MCNMRKCSFPIPLFLFIFSCFAALLWVSSIFWLTGTQRIRSFVVQLLLTCEVFIYEQAINRYLTACHSKLFLMICFCFGLLWLHLAYWALSNTAKSLQLDFTLLSIHGCPPHVHMPWILTQNSVLPGACLPVLPSQLSSSEYPWADFQRH